MSKLSIVQAVQYFRTSDDEIFTDIVAAEAHQFKLDNAEVINKKVTAFLNANKMFGRRRAAYENVAAQMTSFLLQFDGTPVEFDHEAADAEAKAAAEAAKVSEDTAKAATSEVAETAVADEAQL